MFVPLLLLGEALGRVMGQSLVHAQAVDLYCAIGMAAFIAAGQNAARCGGVRCRNHRNACLPYSNIDRRRGGLRGFGRSLGCIQSKAASDAQTQPTGWSEGARDYADADGRCPGGCDSAGVFRQRGCKQPPSRLPRVQG
jgi:hypothetical protein